MRTGGVVLVLVLALALQTTLVSWLPKMAIVDLVLVAVVSAALLNGPMAGMLAGTCAGLLQDALSSGVVGIGGLTKTIVGFVAGLAGAQFILTHAAPRLVVFFAASLLHAALFMGIYELLGLRDFSIRSGEFALRAVANAVVGVLALKAVELAPRLVERSRSQHLRTRRR